MTRRRAAALPADVTFRAGRGWELRKSSALLPAKNYLRDRGGPGAAVPPGLLPSIGQ